MIITEILIGATMVLSFSIVGFFAFLVVCGPSCK